jgi:hypothetical protein
MYPPHHLGGYELVWQGGVRALREAGHGVRVLTTDFRLPEAGPHVEQPLGHLPRASSSAWYQRIPIARSRASTVRERRYRHRPCASSPSETGTRST